MEWRASIQLLTAITAGAAKQIAGHALTMDPDHGRSIGLESGHQDDMGKQVPLFSEGQNGKGPHGSGQARFNQTFHDTKLRCSKEA